MLWSIRMGDSWLVPTAVATTDPRSDSPSEQMRVYDVNCLHERDWHHGALQFHLEILTERASMPSTWSLRLLGGTSWAFGAANDHRESLTITHAKPDMSGL